MQWHVAFCDIERHLVFRIGRELCKWRSLFFDAGAFEDGERVGDQECVGATARTMRDPRDMSFS